MFILVHLNVQNLERSFYTNIGPPREHAHAAASHATLKLAPVVGFNTQSADMKKARP